MKQILLKNAKFGLDTRRDVLTSQLGTFVTLENCHVNQGGEIEGRRAFVKLGQLPQSTFGVEALPNGLVTFGSRAVVLRTSSRQLTANVATLTFPTRVMPTTTNHDFQVGDSILIAGLGVAGYNGTFTITGIAATTISYACVAADEALTADVGGTVSVVILDGFSYQRLRHYRYALGLLQPEVIGNWNPNVREEPVMTSLVHSCCFGGKTLAIAAFDAAPNDFFSAFDPYMKWTGVFSDGVPVDSSYQGMLDITDSGYAVGAAKNYWLMYQLTYVGNRVLKDAGIRVVFGAALDDSLNFIGPINQTFSMVVDDTAGGQLDTALFAAATPETVAVGASLTIYFTKGNAGSISVLKAPLVVDGVIAGTTDLLNGLGPINYDRSLYQTAIDLATRINSQNTPTGYSAQAGEVNSKVAALTIVAPSEWGAVVNAENLEITSTTIFISASPVTGSGGVAAAAHYPFALGVTTAQGTGQIQRVIFNTPQYPLGTYDCTLTFNGLDYQLGAGNLTVKRATMVFFLTSGAAGSVGPVLLQDGTNLLNTNTVAFDTNLVTTAKAIVTSINTKWGGGGLGRFDPTSWAAYLVQVGTIYGVAVLSPTVNPELYNGQGNVVITSTTIKVGAASTDTGSNSLIISLDGATAVPSYLFAMGQKAYCVQGQQVGFSKINDSSRWENQDTGAGFLKAKDLAASPTGVLSVAAYQGKLAALARRSIQIWNIDANPANYSQFQILNNIGTVDKNSVQSIGELDVMFLSDTGIRSLRARETSLNAFVADIGAPVDQLIINSLQAGPNTNICSVVEPSTNSYWLYLNEKIYVLAYYPGLKITAFSTYIPSYFTSLGEATGQIFTYNGLTIGTKYYIFFGDAIETVLTQGDQIIVPEADGSFISVGNSLTVTTPLGETSDGTFLTEQTVFIPEKMVVYNGQVYIRDTNRNVYVFGGLDGATYDGSVVTVETPYLDNGTPYTPKQFRGFDAAIAGKWVVSAGSDPKSGELETILVDGDPDAPNITQDSTFDKGAIPYESQGTHVKLKFVSNSANNGKVLIGAFALLYEDMEAN